MALLCLPGIVQPLAVLALAPAGWVSTSQVALINKACALYGFVVCISHSSCPIIGGITTDHQVTGYAEDVAGQLAAPEARS